MGSGGGHQFRRFPFVFGDGYDAPKGGLHVRQKSFPSGRVSIAGG